MARRCSVVHLLFLVVPVLFLLVTICASAPILPRTGLKYDPDCDRNLTQIIENRGYPWEEHKVQTKDGYILGVFRIPRGRNSSAKGGRPVLLQHGLLDSCSSWVINFPDQSLAYILADAGYDVWLGNVRGNRFSRAHVKYNPDHDEEFWDFSFDDMAHDDLPSTITYILTLTKHTQISYVGHSQGTMIGFAEFSNPLSTIAQNVSFWAALAPVAHLGHIISPIKYLSPPGVVDDIERFWHLLFGRNEFMPSSAIIKWLGTYACSEAVIDKEVCENILFIGCGPETKNMNQSRISVYVAHEPSGTSVKNMVHFAQCVQSNIFGAYDYGSPDKNRLHYNQTTPPVYPIGTMKVPTAVFWAGEDWLADPVDVAYIFDTIESLVYEKYIPDYNHLDFIWATTANEDI